MYVVIWNKPMTIHIVHPLSPQNVFFQVSHTMTRVQIFFNVYVQIKSTWSKNRFYEWSNYCFYKKYRKVVVLTKIMWGIVISIGFKIILSTIHQTSSQWSSMRKSNKRVVLLIHLSPSIVDESKELSHWQKTKSNRITWSQWESSRPCQGNLEAQMSVTIVSTWFARTTRSSFQ